MEDEDGEGDGVVEEVGGQGAEAGHQGREELAEGFEVGGEGCGLGFAGGVVEEVPEAFVEG